MAQPWFEKYNASFLKTPGQNDASTYGVVVEANLGAPYECIGVHHLDQSENNRNHNIYVDILDPQGNRDPKPVIAYTWEGRTEMPLTVICDKPANEPAANIPMFPGQVITVWVHAAPTGDHLTASDRVQGIHTAHNDEPTGNTRGHHSFYVVFQSPEPPGWANPPGQQLPTTDTIPPQPAPPAEAPPAHPTPTTPPWMTPPIVPPVPLDDDLLLGETTPPSLSAVAIELAIAMQILAHAKRLVDQLIAHPEPRA